MGLGCLVLVLLFATCIGIGIAAYAKQGAELEDLAKEDIHLVTTDWSTGSLTSRFDATAAKQSEDVIDRWMALFSRELGPMVRIQSCEQTRAFAGTGGRTGTIVSKVEFEKAIGTVTIVYIREGDNWKIRSFNIDSVALEDALLPQID
jgi:hypothetical protein